MSTLTVRLSREESEYLGKSLSEDPSLAAGIRDHLTVSSGSDCVVVDQAGAERLRDFFTERLALVGFDSDYKPNAEGVLLENMIDRFFLGTWE